MRAIAIFTLKSLRANRVRSLVTIAGVALAAALLTAVMTTYTSLNGFLYDSEAQMSGTWMAKAHGSDAAAMEADIEKARESPDPPLMAILQDVGFGELSAAQQDALGHYLPIASYAGDIEGLCAISPEEGRLPEEPDEIMLPSLWKTHGLARIGDTITVSVGQRRAVATEEATHDSEDASIYHEYDASVYLADSTESDTIQDGSPLDSSMGYLDAAQDGGSFDEELVDIEERSYTVVGFSKPYSYALSKGTGLMGLVGTDPAASGSVSAFLSFTGIDSMAQVEERTEALFPTAHDSYHTALLRYLGIRGGGAVWDTFAGLASILSAVIIIACVSLIYNAFAISVAERASQFGLLASIGASRRQLRRAVLIEGLAVALIGIPAGLLIGLGGCAITFQAIGPMISSVLTEGSVPFGMTIAAWGLGASALLTLATVLVSVLVPAWRVGRVSPIEALKRNRDGNVSARGAKDAHRDTDPARLWRARGIITRLFGIGGLLARTNAKRSRAKGRAASLSLALAIVLLMTAGSLNASISSLVSAADNSVDYDIAVSAQITADDATIEDDIAFFEGAYETMRETPGAEALGWYLGDMLPMVLPDDMVGETFKSNNLASNGAGYRDDGTFGALTTIFYLDDASFDAYAREAGADPQAFYDPSAPKAIGIGCAYSYFDGKYQQVETFTSTGKVRMLVGGRCEGTEIDGFSFYAWTDESGRKHLEFVPYEVKDDRSKDLIDLDLDAYGAARTVLDLESIDTKDIEVACVTQIAPPLVSQHADLMQLIMPLSMAAAESAPAPSPSFRSAFDARDLPHAEVAKGLEESFNAFAQAPEDSVIPHDIVFFSINDYVAQAESTHMIALIVNVFCLLFTVILTLIAMANVFNTVTNGLILRKREFAVMRSIGLSNRQFRSMIANECIAYGLRGLVPGLIVSFVIAYAVHSVVGLSMGGVAFQIPWAYLALALCLTFGAMLASVAYGMYRCKADNVVEALRLDSI